MSKIYELFDDDKLVEKIKSKLPVMFQIAEQEVSRGGKVGMEVGTIREQIIVALLIYKFGEKNVIPPKINEAETDIRVFDELVSVKTRTGKGGVKLIWTVDWEKVDKFIKVYRPRTHLIFVQINWGDVGYFCFIPLEVQQEIFKKLGKERYIKTPKRGTNPRGVEISSEALKMLMEHAKPEKLKFCGLNLKMCK